MTVLPFISYIGFARPIQRFGDFFIVRANKSPSFQILVCVQLYYDTWTVLLHMAKS